MDARKITTDMALIAVFTALIVVFSVVPGINIFGPVPITLQTLAVALTALCLGPWRGAISVCLYLLLGIAELPVFAKGGHGIATFAGASGGYLLSFPIAAIVIGLAARWVLKRFSSAMPLLILLFGAALIGSILVVHPLGILGMARFFGAKKNFAQVVGMDLVFWPGDLIKSFLAAGVATSVLKAFPALFRSPVVSTPEATVEPLR